MSSIVFGLIAICLGFWGFIKYWWYIADILIAVFPLALIFCGSIALMAGIKNTGLRASLMEKQTVTGEPERKAKKKDE